MRSGDRRGPRRILYVEANEDGTVGGSHQALYDLVRSLDRDRYEPEVLFYEDNAFVPRLRDVDVPVHVWEDLRAREYEIRRTSGALGKLREFVATVLRRRRFLIRRRVDMVHINNSPWVGNDDWLPACWLAGIPCVANAMGGADEWDSSRVRRWLFRRFDRVFAISRYVADGMARLGVSRDRIRTIHLGVDREKITQEVSRTPREVRSELDVRDGELLAVMVGNIREWKGQHVVLRALSRLDREDRDRIVLAFAGATADANRDYEDRLRRLIRDAGLESRVRMLGFRTDVPDLFHAADLAVHASVRPEPFGLVLVEAMAVGTPVAAAAAGGPLEILDERSGWTFDPDRPEELTGIFRRALDDRETLAEMGEHGRERVERFSVERYARRMERGYDEIFAGEAGLGSRERGEGEHRGPDPADTRIEARA